MSETRDYVNHTLKSTLRGAVIGGMIASVAAVGLTAIFSAATLGMVPVIGATLAAIAGGSAALWTGTATAAFLGAKWGAAIGAGFGILGADNAVRAAEEKRQIDQERRAMHSGMGGPAPAQMQQVAQTAYMAGMQEGQQATVNKIRELQFAALHQEMEKNKAACAAQGPHAQAEIKRREAAAAAGQQIA